ncbi:BlaI/MecI/CopY family transcriptional regulator [Streptomyces sp. NPDC091377]|uniref:BlaI/MecI/CopY family transcriptional regulator n=1 Tax=Streptomyces sp. NPDC091377 TaxID=3365995 RepID=UPI003828C6E9
MSSGPTVLPGPSGRCWSGSTTAGRSRWRTTPVQTVMEILHRKEWLARAKSGRAFNYRATKSREEYGASLIDQVWATGADRTATLVRLFDELEPGERAELRAALAERAGGERA